MHHISKATAVITFPARTAFAVASAGLRTTVRLVGWAAEQATGQAGTRPSPVVTVPAPRPTEPEVRAEPDVDPMEPTREAPPEVVAPLRKAAAKKAPAKKVPASQVPLKSAPTPSLPAGVADIDAALDADELAPRRPAAKKAAKKAPAKKAPAKKTPAHEAAAKTAATKAPAKKAPAKKAPSKQAAVLAPALGLSEDEVVQVVESGTDQA